MTEDRCKHGMIREWCSDCKEQKDEYWIGDRYVTKKQLRQAKNCLTERQLEILWMTAQGMTQERIAECLKITQAAVSYHLKAARKKTRGKLV